MPFLLRIQLARWWSKGGVLFPSQTSVCDCEVGTCGSSLVSRLAAQQHWYGLVAGYMEALLAAEGLGCHFHLWLPSCSVSLRADFTEFLHISVPLYLKKITFYWMSQKCDKKTWWREHRISCFLSPTSAGSFWLCSAKDSKHSGKAGTKAPADPLPSANHVSVF